LRQQIPALLRTFNLSFHNFPGPKSFFRTFQVPKSLQKNARTFQEAWEPCSALLS